MAKKKKPTTPLAIDALKKHFGKTQLASLVAANRTFPFTSRADLQKGLENIFADTYEAALYGIHPQYSHEPLSISHMATEGNYPPFIGPLQHDEIDLGETVPARCIQHGLWLGSNRGLAFAVLVTPAHRYGQALGVKVEIAVQAGEKGAIFSRAFFRQLEQLVNRAGSYRGKVISLETGDSYTGYTGASIRVLRLHTVKRDEVILPHKTLDLLDRNVGQFIRQREHLQKLGMPIKKGLLFYGPPGTGKTHTIHYLASQLQDHTTLLITAEQVGLLATYMQLARFLQPAMIVIEDVDLIARDRTQMHGPCEESLLNKLLNEMDGLREDASILFVLTTNRPEQLETALASRPGRIDQAIEFPLPDEEGRRKLVHMYARGLTLNDELMATAVRKTHHASAAFIKELMRRSAQYLIEENGQQNLKQKHIDAALEEMLFSGGTLNLKLLGAEQSTAVTEFDKEKISSSFQN